MSPNDSDNADIGNNGSILSPFDNLLLLETESIVESVKGRSVQEKKHL